MSESVYIVVGLLAHAIEQMNFWMHEQMHFFEEATLPKPSTREVHAAIAAYIADSRISSETFAAIARRLNISISTLRRVAAEFGIVRRQRLGQSVLERIERAREEETR